MLHGPTARDEAGHPIVYLVRSRPRAGHVGACAGADVTRATQRLLDAESWTRVCDQAYAYVLDRVCAEMDASPPIDTFVVVLDMTVRATLRARQARPARPP
jgi:hypothetical protein